MDSGTTTGLMKMPKSKWTEEEFRSVCAAARTAFIAKGSTPNLDELDAVCEVPRGKIARIISEDSFAETLELTGIRWRQKKGLTALQHMVLVSLTDPHDKRPVHKKLADFGVSGVMYKSWLRQPLFAGLVDQFAEQALGDHMAVAHTALMNQVAKENLSAIQFYYELTGRHDPRQKQERDVQTVIAQVIDIIQRNVPLEFQAKIAEEMAAIQGKPVPKELTAYRPEYEPSAEEVINAVQPSSNSSDAPSFFKPTH